MKSMFIAATLLGVIYLTVGAPHRARRNLYDFKRMIEHATGRSSGYYNGYGCYCGRGGSGTPVDDIDRCCKAHDQCYQHLIDEGHNPWTEWYSWSGVPKTTVSSATIQCDDLGGTPNHRTCACDREAVYCFSRQTYYGKRNCEGQFSPLNPSGVRWSTWS